MSGSVSQPWAAARPRALARPPVPHEHGAWIILYAPAATALALARPFVWVPALLVVVAITAAFLAREAAGRLMRGRRQPGTAAWLGIYLAVLAASSLPLLVVYHRTPLVWIGAMAAALFAAHSALLAWPGRRRLDRSQWGETLGVAALTLTAPAACAATSGRVGPEAYILWAACIAYFSSGVLFVKMLLAGVRTKTELTGADRWRLARQNLMFHGMLGLIAACAAWRLGGQAGGLLALAYVPAIVRAVRGSAALSHRPPSLKRVGLLEGVYAAWFLGCLLTALLLAGVRS
jgi:hypothetical protein